MLRVCCGCVVGVLQVCCGCVAGVLRVFCGCVAGVLRVCCGCVAGALQCVAVPAEISEGFTRQQLYTTGACCGCVAVCCSVLQCVTRQWEGFTRQQVYKTTATTETHPQQTATHSCQVCCRCVAVHDEEGDGEYLYISVVYIDIGAVPSESPPIE